MRRIFTLIILLSAPTVGAEGLRCTQIFEKSATSSIDQEAYSWRRFQKPLQIHQNTSAVEQKWLGKIGSALFPLRYFLGFNKETIATVHLSPNQEVAITRSQQGQFRVHDSDTAEILATVDLSTLRKTGTQLEGRLEVIAVGATQFVIGLESASHILKNQHLNMKVFQPQSIFLFNFKGELISQFSTPYRFKGSLLDGSAWIVADQNEVPVIDPLQSRNISISVFNHSHHLLREDYAISAIGRSSTDQTLLVAYSRFRHRTKVPSYIAAYDISDPFHPRFLREIQVDEAQVIYAMKHQAGRLDIQYSVYEQSPQEAPRTLTIDW